MRQFCFLYSRLIEFLHRQNQLHFYLKVRFQTRWLNKQRINNTNSLSLFDEESLDGIAMTIKITTNQKVTRGIKL